MLCDSTADVPPLEVRATGTAPDADKVLSVPVAHAQMPLVQPANRDPHET